MHSTMRTYYEKCVIRLWKHKNRKEELRIPGGKSKNGDHASFGIIYRFNYQIQEIEILVVPYDPRFSPEEEIPVPDHGSAEEQTFSEDPRGTLEREILEETGIIAKSYHEIGRQSIRDNRPGKQGQHWKYLYCINVYDDTNLRQAPPKNSTIGTPFWVPLSLLSDYIFGHHMWMLNSFNAHRRDHRDYSNLPKSLRVA